MSITQTTLGRLRTRAVVGLDAVDDGVDGQRDVEQPGQQRAASRHRVTHGREQRGTARRSGLPGPRSGSAASTAAGGAGRGRAGCRAGAARSVGRGRAGAAARLAQHERRARPASPHSASGTPTTTASATAGQVVEDGVLDEARRDLEAAGVDQVVERGRRRASAPSSSRWPTSSVRNQRLPSASVPKAAAVRSGRPR